MTSTPVMGSESLLNINFMNQTSKTSKTDLGAFKDFLNKSSKEAESDIKSSLPKKQTDIENTKAAITENNVKVTDKTTEVDKSSEVDAKAEDAKVSNVKDAVEKVVEEIKEELGVTDEEILDVLSTLGLTLIALLDEDTMPKIIAELTGSEDTMSLVTSQDLYDSLSNIIETVETVVNELSDELEIPETELKEAVKANENVPLEEAHSFAKTLTEAADETVSEEESFEEKITIVNNRDEKQTVKTEDNPTETKAEVKETVEVEKPEAKHEEHHESHHEAKDNSFTGFVNNIIQKAVESLNAENKVESYSTFDAKNVLNQITESIRFDLSNELNEVNLRLHPETLGTVNVKVTTNSEGIMTAQFTAQNEQVKAIIENQAIVLKETLEAKGVTVEAVEVLVQSHEFDRNLSEQNKGQEDKKGSKKTHRINLIEDEDIETSEGDEVIRQMMAQNGNTIDYSA